MKLNRGFLTVLCFFAAMAVFARGGQDRAWPSHAIEIIVPSGAGGGQDTLARVFQPMLERDLGVPLRITNLPGGSHVRGTIQAFSQPADGYTIYIGGPTILIQQVFGRLPFVFTDEFVPIARIQSEHALLWTSPTGRFRTIEDMIAYGRNNPGSITVTLASPGGIDEASLAHFTFQTGVELALVPMDTGGERLAATLGGHVDFIKEEVQQIGDMLHTRQLIPLIVLADERIDTPELRHVPSAGELGIMGMCDFSTYRFFAVRRGTPQEVIDRMLVVLRNAYDNPEYRRYAAAHSLDLIPGWMGPEELARRWVRDIGLFTETFRRLGRL